MGFPCGFLPLVQTVWGEQIGGCAMVRISKKLKKLKNILWKWNQEVFGRVEIELKKLEDRITGLEVSLSRGYDAQAESKLLQCKQNHSQ